MRGVTQNARFWLFIPKISDLFLNWNSSTTCIQRLQMSCWKKVAAGLFPTVNTFYSSANLTHLSIELSQWERTLPSCAWSNEANKYGTNLNAYRNAFLQNFTFSLIVSKIRLFLYFQTKFCVADRFLAQVLQGQYKAHFFGKIAFLARMDLIVLSFWALAIR